MKKNIYILASLMLLNTFSLFGALNITKEKLAIIGFTAIETLIINSYRKNLGLLDADTNLSARDLALTNLARSFPTVLKLFNKNTIDMHAQELPLVDADNKEALGVLGLQSLQNFFLLPTTSKNSATIHFFESQLLTMLGHITAWGVYFSYVAARKALQDSSIAEEIY